jgi:hypothetical protein
MGKKVLEPSLESPLVEGSMGIGPVTEKIVQRAEVAAEVATQATGDVAQLQADKNLLEQRTYDLENKLNQALSQQSAAGNAAAATYEAERQSIMAQANQVASDLAQAQATATAATQALESANAQLAAAAEHENAQITAAVTAEQEKAALAIEKARQEAAANALAGKEPATGSSQSAGPSLTVPTPALKDKYLSDWTNAADIANQAWMTDYPKQTSNQTRLAWFAKFEAAAWATERKYPGFGVWVANNRKALVNAMATEKAKVLKESQTTGSVDPNLAMWKKAGEQAMAMWTVNYPKISDNAQRLAYLNTIYVGAQNVEKQYPGFMKWFEQAYPGVSAKMIAEVNRLKVGTPPTAAQFKAPSNTSQIKTTPIVTQAAPTVIDPKIVADYNSMLTAWAAYKQLTNDTQRMQAMQKFQAWRASTGKAAWDYARQKNPTFTTAVDAESRRLSDILAKLGVGGASKTSPVFVKGFGLVDENVLKAQQLRDAAKIMHADALWNAQRNVKLTRMMGR